MARARLLVSATLLITLLALTACGDSESADGPSVPTATAIDAAAIPETAPLIDQFDIKFVPNNLTVQAGEAVYFHNSETPIHTVTINGQNVSGDMRRDQARVWTAPGPGTYKITCNYHPQMKATLTVE